MNPIRFPFRRHHPRHRFEPRRRTAGPALWALLAAASAACSPSAHSPAVHAAAASWSTTAASAVRYFGDEYLQQQRTLPTEPAVDVAAF